jgi:peptidoglycan/LPS O-acetylase OafA/YrhL
MRHLAPFVVFLLLPMMIGIASGLWLRNARRASLVAAFGSVLAVGLGVEAGDPDGSWHWVAALLVLPLPVAFALVAAFVCHERTHARRRRPG